MFEFFHVGLLILSYIYYKYMYAHKNNHTNILGAIMTTTESLLYEILGDSEHPDFKPVAKLLKESNEQINEFAGDSSY
jgi:hypothetical protein